MHLLLYTSIDKSFAPRHLLVVNTDNGMQNVVEYNVNAYILILQCATYSRRTTYIPGSYASRPRI